ncbi:hypothetical protein [Nonomuraea sp. NPDC049709]|uniref:hypothetical protein n=1 Tax=Nonomuraea sp. NPDC049709 TaxID=3154736 RepID=UPI00341A2407
MLEPMIAILDDLCAQDRQVLADVINRFSQEETDPDRQLTAWEAPATLGLLTDDCLRS